MIKLGFAVACALLGVGASPVATPLTFAVDYSTDDTVSWNAALVWGEENGADYVDGSVFLAYLGGVSYFGAMISGDVMFRVPYGAVTVDDIQVIEDAYDAQSSIRVTWDVSGNFASYTIL